MTTTHYHSYKLVLMRRRVNSDPRTTRWDEVVFSTMTAKGECRSPIDPALPSRSLHIVVSSHVSTRTHLDDIVHALSALHLALPPPGS